MSRAGFEALSREGLVHELRQHVKLGASFDFEPPATPRPGMYNVNESKGVGRLSDVPIWKMHRIPAGFVLDPESKYRDKLLPLDVTDNYATSSVHYNKEGYELLSDYVRLDDSYGICRYLNAFPERVNDRCKMTGDTVAILAAKTNNVGLIELLISYKADFNLMNNVGIYPLTVACGSGQLALAKLILKHSSLTIICKSNDSQFYGDGLDDTYNYIQTVKYDKNLGADGCSITGTIGSSINGNIHSNFIEKTLFKSPVVSSSKYSSLMGVYYDIGKTNPEGETDHTKYGILFLAARSGLDSVTFSILNHYLNRDDYNDNKMTFKDMLLNQRDDITGCCVLHYAAITNSGESLKLILTHLSQIERFRFDYQGRTALHYACMHNSYKCISILLHFSIDLETKDNNGVTCLSLIDSHEMRAKFWLMQKEFEAFGGMFGDIIRERNEPELYDLENNWTYTDRVMFDRRYRDRNYRRRYISTAMKADNRLCSKCSMPTGYVPEGGSSSVASLSYPPENAAHDDYDDNNSANNDESNDDNVDNYNIGALEVRSLDVENIKSAQHIVRCDCYTFNENNKSLNLHNLDLNRSDLVPLFQYFEFNDNHRFHFDKVLQILESNNGCYEGSTEVSEPPIDYINVKNDYLQIDGMREGKDRDGVSIKSNELKESAALDEFSGKSVDQKRSSNFSKADIECCRYMWTFFNQICGINGIIGNAVSRACTLNCLRFGILHPRQLRHLLAVSSRSFNEKVTEPETSSHKNRSTGGQSQTGLIKWDHVETAIPKLPSILKPSENPDYLPLPASMKVLKIDNGGSGDKVGASSSSSSTSSSSSLALTTPNPSSPSSSSPSREKHATSQSAIAKVADSSFSSSSSPSSSSTTAIIADINSPDKTSKINSTKIDFDSNYRRLDRQELQSRTLDIIENDKDYVTEISNIVYRQSDEITVDIVKQHVDPVPGLLFTLFDICYDESYHKVIMENLFKSFHEKKPDAQFIPKKFKHKCKDVEAYIM